MKVLIVGASGFVGSSLVKFFVEKGFKCYGVSRTTGLIEKDILSSDNFKFIQFDLRNTDRGIPEILMQKFDIVYYSASLQPNPSKKWQDYYEINVKIPHSTYRFVDSDMFVLISTASVYGNPETTITEKSPVDPIDYYGLSKFIAEKLIQFEFLKGSSTKKTVIVRFNSMVGKNLKDGLIKTFYDTLSRGETLELFDEGRPLRNVIHIDDVVEILYRIFLNRENFDDFDIVVAGSKDSVSMFDIANYMKQALNSKSKIVLSKKSGRYSKDILMDISKLVSKINYTPNSTMKAIERYLTEVRRNSEG